MEEKKKQYTRYTINGRRVTKADFDKMFDKTQAGFDKVFDTAMGGFDRAMAGVDRAMDGVDKAMDGVDKATDRFGERIDKVFEERDDEIKMTTKSIVKKGVRTFAIIWLALFFLVFGIYFFGKALKGTDTKPLPPASTSLEEKTTQEEPDALFRKL